MRRTLLLEVQKIQRLKKHINAIVVHSDNERKRLFTQADKDLYSSKTTDRVYSHLLDCANDIIESGYSALVDASFLNADHREIFKKAAEAAGVEFYILNCKASKQQLESRIQQRKNDTTSLSDADTTIMHKQLDNYRPLKNNELVFTITVNNDEAPIDFDSISQALRCNPD